MVNPAYRASDEGRDDLADESDTAADGEASESGSSSEDSSSSDSSEDESAEVDAETDAETDGVDDDPDPCPGQMLCDGVCVDTQTDPEHCGGCGIPCGVLESCIGGECLGDPEARLVFVTDKTWSVDEIESYGPMEICKIYSEQVGLSGDYLAWIRVDGELGPVDTFSKWGWFHLADGTTVAESWDELISGELLHPIDLDHDGSPVVTTDMCPNGTAVWTGVTAMGVPYGSDCEGWTTNAVNTYGAVGFSEASDYQWSQSGCDVSCTQHAYLYCFEQ